MTHMTRISTTPHRLAAATAMLMCIGIGAAHAGTCPADKVVADGKGQPASSLPASGVTDTVLTSSDLAKQPIGINDRLFRLRRLVVQPGGVVPWHSHADRPALIYIISGEIVEYSSTCAVPIVHKAGEATAETASTQHWWKNLGKQTVVLISADLFNKGHGDNHDNHMM